ncbi:MAG: hypothetical protein M3R36_07250 [Bacteroidota bacterium]|nr:hypothetical protein [Bacteroidota bacterium]
MGGFFIYKFKTKNGGSNKSIWKAENAITDNNINKVTRTLDNYPNFFNPTTK